MEYLETKSSITYQPFSDLSGGAEIKNLREDYRRDHPYDSSVGPVVNTSPKLTFKEEDNVLRLAELRRELLLGD